MSASRCLTAWNWPMGRPNWTRTLAYSVAVSRHHRAPPACSAASRATTTCRTRRWSARQLALRRPPATESTSTTPTRRVGSRLASGATVHRPPGPADVEQAPDHAAVRRAGPAPAPARRGGPEHRPERPRHHDARRPRRRSTTSRQASPKATAAGVPPSTRPGAQAGLLRAWPPRPAGRGRHGGQERARAPATAGLLQDHGQLEETEALAAELLGQVDAQPPLGGQLLPHRLQLFGLGVEQGPGHARRAVGVEPPPDGLPLRLVLVGDCDRHRAPLLVSPRPRRRLRLHRLDGDGLGRAALGGHPDPVLGVTGRVDDHRQARRHRGRRCPGPKRRSCPSPRTCRGRSRSGSSLAPDRRGRPWASRSRRLRTLPLWSRAVRRPPPTRGGPCSWPAGGPT